MVARLREGVLVRNPETDRPEYLPAGSDVPGWAADLVGDHALEATKPSPAKKAEPAKKAPAKGD